MKELLQNILRIGESVTDDYHDQNFVKKLYFVRVLKDEAFYCLSRSRGQSYKAIYDRNLRL